MSWAARLAALNKSKYPNADSAFSADSPRNRPTDTTGTNGIRAFLENRHYLKEEAKFAAIQADNHHNRPNGINGTIDIEVFSENRPFTCDSLEDSVERAAIQAEDQPVRRLRKRPISWARADDEPAPGDFCGCCSGSLWWSDTDPPHSWCCTTCHPPAHLQIGQFRVVAT